MNIKINVYGQLEIERAGTFKIQRCPHNDTTGCGDWCPLFGEPRVCKGENKKSFGALDICNHMLVTEYGEKIIDERKK